MNGSTQDVFRRVCEHARQTALLKSVQDLLEWDERTLLPRSAGTYRAEQVTQLAGMIHRRQCDPELGQWLEQLAESPLAAEPHSDAGTTIRRLRREFAKRVKIPTSLVEELARTSIRGQQAWVDARQRNDFACFLPWLERIVQLKRQQAEAVGYESSPYDALLDDYEPQAKTADIARVLARLRHELVPLVQSVVESGRQAPIQILKRTYPLDAQKEFGTSAAACIGFDFERGRLDVTHHPFCTTLGPDDCRITTRYDENFFPSAFFSILHEAGHGIYEQGLRVDQFGLPPGSAVSLGIHESQSRLWENFVGRSQSFWQHFFPQAVKAFPSALREVSEDDFFWAINDVRPSLVRVEADEATYNLHIIFRFELEQELIQDNLPAADLPAAWNAKCEEYLGLRPPRDADGVLQDIHWSAAAIGYFPTYTLGNLYAAQLFARAESELGDVDAMLARGDFLPLRQWLSDQVYRYGQCYDADQLVEKVTGMPPSHDPLMRHLTTKYGTLYGL